MEKGGYVLGIDTSNYRTSVALTCGNSIEADLRKQLEVRKGDRGLRQSEALFQHVKNLPMLFEGLGKEYTDRISAIAYSSRPRPVEGSYMPCFLAGESFARSLGAVLDVPVRAFSHQEGHIEAVKRYSGIDDDRDFIACHFSGGTCELLKVSKGEDNSKSAYEIERIGGSKDISFGQVLDRAGVAMGMDFPCGELMDSIAIAIKAKPARRRLTAIKVKGCELNLSGIDTRIKRLAEGLPDSSLIYEIFAELSSAIGKMLIQAGEVSGLTDVIMAGGVSSSRFIRRELEGIKNMRIVFDDMNLSSDNAVGIAFLGGSRLWD